VTSLEWIESDDARDVARRLGRSGPNPHPLSQLELVGPGEVADRLKVNRSTVAQWRSRYPNFPTPLAFLSDGARQIKGKAPSPGLPVWQWSQIREWAEATGRL
jgi:hypothetical protein